MRAQRLVLVVVIVVLVPMTGGRFVIVVLCPGGSSPRSKIKAVTKKKETQCCLTAKARGNHAVLFRPRCDPSKQPGESKREREREREKTRSNKSRRSNESEDDSFLHPPIHSIQSRREWNVPHDGQTIGPQRSESSRMTPNIYPQRQCCCCCCCCCRQGCGCGLAHSCCCVYIQTQTHTQQ